MSELSRTSAWERNCVRFIRARPNFCGHPSYVNSHTTFRHERAARMVDDLRGNARSARDTPLSTRKSSAHMAKGRLRVPHRGAPPCQETLTFEGLLRWKSVAERSLTQRTTLSGNLYKTRRFITAGGGCVPPRCTTFVVPQRTFSRMPASQSSKRPRPHRFHPGGGRWTHLAQAHGRRKQKRHAGSISIIGELVAIGRMRTAACSSRSTRPLHLRLHLRLRGARHWKRPSTYARTSRAPRFPRPTGYPPVRRTNRQA